jgi:glucokinase
VLNDFEAVGYGIPVLPGDAIIPLHAVPPEAHAPLAVLGPGTGLGQAQLFWEEGAEAGAGAYRVQPSEGAHATFAPRGARQRALQAAVEEEEGYCCIERVGAAALVPPG